MDLSQFKILKEDAENFHIISPSGHKMSVHKALLSGPAKAAIQKLCAGGMVQAKADGGAVAPNDDLSFASNLFGFSGPEKEKAEAARKVEKEKAHNEEMAISGYQAAPSVDPVQQIDTAVVAPAGGVPSSIAAAPADPVAQAPAAAAPPDAMPMDPLTQKGMSTDQLLTKEQGDISDLAKAQMAESGQQTKAYKDYNDAMAKMQTPEQVVETYRAKDDALMKAYLDKKIDPDHYTNNMTTGARIRAGIAMALGGLGAGAAGGPNHAMEWFKNAIDRDMESQKNEQGKSYNLWRMNREAMGDDMKAKIATQNQLWTGVQAKISMAAAAAQAPVAKFRAQQMINDIEKQKVQNRMTMGLLTQGQQGGGAFSGADPSQLVQTMVPKELQPKVYEEIGAAQNTAKNTPGILQAFDAAANQVHAVDFIPGTQNVHQKSLHALLGPTFADIEGTVRQAAMDNMNNNVTPQFGDSQSTIDTKRKTLLGYLHSKQAAPIAKGNGIDLSRFSSTTSNPLARLPSEQQNIYKWAQAHPQDEKAKMAMEKFKDLGIGD